MYLLLAPWQHTLDARQREIGTCSEFVRRSTEGKARVTVYFEGRNGHAPPVPTMSPGSRGRNIKWTRPRMSATASCETQRSNSARIIRDGAWQTGTVEMWGWCERGQLKREKMSKNMNPEASTVRLGRRCGVSLHHTTCRKPRKYSHYGGRKHIRVSKGWKKEASQTREMSAYQIMLREQVLRCR